MFSFQVIPILEIIQKEFEFFKGYPINVYLSEDQDVLFTMKNKINQSFKNYAEENDIFNIDINVDIVKEGPKFYIIWSDKLLEEQLPIEKRKIKII